MFDHYHRFTVEDFLADAWFRAWVLDQNPEAVRFWESWISQNHPQREVVLTAAATLRTLEEKKAVISDEEVRALISSTLSEIRESDGTGRVGGGRMRWLRVAMSAAAVVCLVIGARWLMLQKSMQPEVVRFAVGENDHTRTNAGAKPDTLLLEDGSSVVLYPGAALQYPEVFGEESRTVRLKGKAFFQIAHDPDHPFVVFTDDLITKVLGTSFTIDTGISGVDTRVSVHSGRVSVFLSKDQNADSQLHDKQLAGVILTRNQEVVYTSRETRLLKRIVSEPEMVNDVPVSLDFEEKPVNEILEKLEQAYGIELVYDEEKLSTCSLTANLSDVQLYEGLDLVCRLIKGHYEMIDGKIIIYSKGCETH